MGYVYFCPNCGYLGSMEAADCMVVCPKCQNPLFATHLEKDEWSKMNEREKEARKQRWASLYATNPDFPVTTGDLHEDYEIIGPVYFQVSNKGLFSSSLSQLTSIYSAQINAMKNSGTMSREKADWGFLYGEWSAGQNQFESAFYIATQELKKRALLVGGDAIIGMRQDIDLDSNGFSFFYLQMYGTAVKRKASPGPTAGL